LWSRSATGRPELPWSNLRQLSHGALRMLAGFEPVVVHASHADVGRQLGYRRELQHAVEQFSQLILPCL
jgi:hypothetical protein